MSRMVQPFPIPPRRGRPSAVLLGLALCLGACQSGDGLGTGAPAPAARAGSLADGPLPAMMPTSTSVGVAGTGPAGQNAAIGDGTAAFGGR